MTKDIQWGIIGCGDVTEVKSGPAFNQIKGSKLQAVMRRNGDKARDYALRHKVPCWYDNASKLIHDPQVHAIYVATPPGSHAEYAIQAMQAGKPVYVEKPMAATYRECLEMIKVSEQTGVPLFVAYYRRMLPGFLKVKEIINSGILGKILFFSIKYMVPPQPEDYFKPLPWRVNPELSGGGYVFDLGSHQLDLIDYFLGPVKKTSSLAINQRGLYQPEDFISAGFKGQNEIVGNAIWWFTAPPYCREDWMEIVGERGKIVFSCFGFNNISVTLDGIVQCYDNVRPQCVQQGLIESIVDELSGRGKCPSTAKSAARTSKLLDQIVKKHHY